MERLSGLQTHQGVSVILRRPRWEFTDLLGLDGTVPLLLVAAGVSDPGNLGALVRAAQALGATGLIALQGSADPFRDKALRGSSGAVFGLPCMGGCDLGTTCGDMRAQGLQILYAQGGEGADCWDTDLARPTALVLGAEGSGVPQEIIDEADGAVSVPMAAGVESLNVAVAAGVLLFEARRQRR